MIADANAPDWDEVESAFAAVIEMPLEEQSAFLGRQSPAVRLEVESLLAAHRRCDTFLEQSTVLLSPGDSSTLAPGTQIGPYSLDSVVGEGGMGIVYRARDTRLNRTVAIKFLFDDLADLAARRRFQREAQMASALNHPHIVTVHDAGEFESRQYLVTEYIEGGTLRDWARAHSRTWREIVELMSGLADGLATAHGAGILHRDLKPGNILVTRGGLAKLSDFGLAKLQQPAEAEQSASPEADASRSGIILGTIAYMSPEQGSGRPVDARSDIFSFGIVLYELIAGHRPFDGASDLETLQKIIHAPAAPLTGELPFALRMVIEKSLDKDPAARYQSTRDLVVDLRRLARQSDEAYVKQTQAVLKTRRPGRSMAMILAIIFLISVGVWVWLHSRPIAISTQAVEFEISAPVGTTFAPPINRQAFAVSPDGRRLAFSATDDTGSHLWLRSLDSTAIRMLPGTEEAISVFWPPDSRSIFFSTKQTLMQLNLESGSERSVATLHDHVQDASWRSNGDILVYAGGGHAWFELGAEAGSLRALAHTPDRWPQVLPVSDRVIYAALDSRTDTYRAQIAEYPALDPVALMETSSRVQYAPPRRAGESGYLLYMHESNLLAQAFDPDRKRLMGASFPIARDVIYYGPTLAANFSVSTSGVLVYQAHSPLSDLQWHNRAGLAVGTVGKPAMHWGNVRVSRDGRKVAAAVWDPGTGGAGIWTFDADGRESRRITYPPDVQRRPVWSPDGKRIAFGGSRIGGPKLAIVNVASGGPDGLSPEYVGGSVTDFVMIPTDWSHDGRFIASDDGTPHEVLAALITDVAARKTFPLLQDKFAQWGAAFSPDDKQIAFVSMESGRPEVYLHTFEAQPIPRIAGERRQLSKGGAWQVRWRADGRELFCLGLDNQIYAVPVTGNFVTGSPKPLFRIPGVSHFNTTRDFQFDVSPDGQRFLFPSTGSIAPPPFTVIENWQDKFHR